MTKDAEPGKSDGSKQVHRLAIVGLGKIARDQHVPALRRDSRFALVATADPNNELPGVPAFPTLDALLSDGPRIDAVSICTPPAGRLALVERALAADLAIMIEKPPAATPAEVETMRALAAKRGTTVFAAWHSREAGAVVPAKAWLKTRRIRSFAIDWREDIRRWHPGQDWILAADGFGVFDPAINAFSILTAILDGAVTVSNVSFDIPINRQTPIAAELAMSCNGITGAASLDFLEAASPRWIIDFATDDGVMSIIEGGRGLITPEGKSSFANEEYSRLYGRFHDLIVAGRSEIDARPSEIVADAFRVASKREAAAFDW